MHSASVALGHSNADAPGLRAAVAAGARLFTHLANACPQMLDRHDNIVWRVLDTPGLAVSLIADGIHVAPAAFRLMQQQIMLIGQRRVELRMQAAELEPRRH